VISILQHHIIKVRSRCTTSTPYVISVKLMLDGKQQICLQIILWLCTAMPTETTY